MFGERASHGGKMGFNLSLTAESTAVNVRSWPGGRWRAGGGYPEAASSGNNVVGRVYFFKAK